MIKILDGSLNRLGIIKAVTSASRAEEINGENTFDFTAILDNKLKDLVDESTVFEIGDDYFDIAFFKNETNDDGSYSMDVESEHVSYRLNREEYNVEYFTETGTPSYILGKILEGTGFTVGTVDITNQVTYSAQEAKSRRQLLMEFIAYVDGEGYFNKFSIGITSHRGSAVSKPLIKGKNVRVLNRTVNKREKDVDGNPVKSYVCEPLYVPGDNYALGDNVRLIQNELGISEELRIVRLEYSPYFVSEVKLTFANYANTLASSLYQIETSAVIKDKLYNGVRIGPEYGVEVIRNDLKARSYNRSDGMAWQSGDGTGTYWKDRLYYEYDSVLDETILVYDGKFSTYSIEAIKAEIDIVVSNTVIVQNLYAQYGRIADLSVNELDTSFKKITNYLLKDTNLPESISDIRYQRQYDDRREIWICTTDGTEDEPVLGANDTPLYWTDATKTQMHTDVTDYPVKQWVYVEILKQEEGTELVNGVYIPYIIYGAGDEVTALSGKMKEQKLEDGHYWTYYKRTSGEPVVIGITDDGPVGMGSSGGTSLPVGGVAGAVLTKISDEDGDVEWKNGFIAYNVDDDPSYNTIIIDNDTGDMSTNVAITALGPTPPSMLPADGCIVVYNNRIYLLGNGVSTAIWIFDLELGTWSNSGVVGRAQYVAQRAVVSDGKFYIIGGATGTTATTLTQMFDPDLLTLTTKSAMQDSKFSGAIGEYAGSIFYIGGGTGTNSTPTVNVYNIVSNTWSYGNAIPANRSDTHFMQLDHYVYLVGGATYYNNAKLTTAYVYDLIAQTTSVLTAMPDGRSRGSMLVFGNKMYVFYGSMVTVNYPTSVAEYDFTTATWRTLSINTPTPGNGSCCYPMGSYTLSVGGSTGLGTSVGVIKFTAQTWIHALYNILAGDFLYLSAECYIHDTSGKQLQVIQPNVKTLALSSGYLISNQPTITGIIKRSVT